MEQMKTQRRPEGANNIQGKLILHAWRKDTYTDLKHRGSGDVLTEASPNDEDKSKSTPTLPGCCLSRTTGNLRIISQVKNAFANPSDWMLCYKQPVTCRNVHFSPVFLSLRPALTHLNIRDQTHHSKQRLCPFTTTRIFNILTRTLNILYIVLLPNTLARFTHTAFTTHAKCTLHRTNRDSLVVLVRLVGCLSISL